MARILLGGLVAGIIIFFWGFAAHEALPLGETGIHDLPQEEVFSKDVKDAVKEPGIYLLPGRAMMRSKSAEEQRLLLEKVAKGPTGFLIIHPEGSETALPKYLLPQFLTNVFCGILAAFLVTQLRPGFLVRVLCVAFMGVFGFVMVCVPYWNWYGFPLDFTIAQFIEHTVGWFLAGIALAAIVRPSAAAKPAIPAQA
jgi:hypothetical protein